jgi:hypothetical protein
VRASPIDSPCSSSISLDRGHFILFLSFIFLAYSNQFPILYSDRGFFIVCLKVENELDGKPLRCLAARPSSIPVGIVFSGVAPRDLFSPALNTRVCSTSRFRCILRSAYLKLYVCCISCMSSLRIVWVCVVMRMVYVVREFDRVNLY